MTDFSADLAANEHSIRNLMRAFLASVAIVGGGVMGWAATTKIDSAVIVAGTFAVKSNAQTIQHPEGGVVGAIFVHEGELVKEGQPLIRLDAAQVARDAGIVERQLSISSPRAPGSRRNSRARPRSRFRRRPWIRPRRCGHCGRAWRPSKISWTKSSRPGTANWRSSPNTIPRSRDGSAG